MNLEEDSVQKTFMRALKNSNKFDLASTNFNDSNRGILLLGLAIVVVAVNIPRIGTTINFLLTVVGIGRIVQHLFRAYATPTPA